MSSACSTSCRAHKLKQSERRLVSSSCGWGKQGRLSPRPAPHCLCPSPLLLPGCCVSKRHGRVLPARLLRNRRGNHAVLPEPAVTLLIFLLGCTALYFGERKQPSLQNRTDLVLPVSCHSVAELWPAPPPQPPCSGAPKVLQVKPSRRQIPSGTRRGGGKRRECTAGLGTKWHGVYSHLITSKGPLSEFFSL